MDALAVGYPSNESSLDSPLHIGYDLLHLYIPVLSVSRSIMCVERSAPRSVACPPLFVAPHGLLSAHSRVTMPPDGLSFYIRRYRHDSLTATDD